MKELDSFTVERLEGWIAAGDIAKDHHDGVRVAGECLAALARIALAAKRAEPEAYGTLQKEFCDEERSLFTDKDSASKYSESCYALTPLYTTPQLNSPEIPEGWISIPRDMLADYRDVKNAEIENYKAGFAGYYDQEGTRWARDFAYLCEELAAIDKVLAAAPERPL